MQIQIRHSGYKNSMAEFFIIRGSDLKQAGPVYLKSPEQIRVQGRPQSNLRQDVKWYLENYLELPLGGNISVAERTEAALQAWGTDCFDAINQGRAAGFFLHARDDGLENLTLTITSDDPNILSWPWEALHSPDDGFLALRCRIERQLSELGDTVPPHASLPKDRINILLVISRPFGNKDVGFHSLARPMVEAVKNFPVHVDVLRPPTFDQLKETLFNKPGYYHIVHFDGHGGYGEEQVAGSIHTFRGPQGKLVFENAQAQPELVEAERLSHLLAEHRIPIMILNACQSAMVDEHAKDAFASVAASLLKAGIRSVVAMGYSLYVSGAQQFIPAFYKQLLKTGNVVEAVRLGRQAMYDKPGRACSLGEYALKDWLVPVVYQQIPSDETILPVGIGASQRPSRIGGTSHNKLPDEARESGDYGFIGREQAIHELERAMIQQPQGAILLHGMAGIGKTTLAKGFLQWLADTGGLPDAIFWFDFREIRSAEYIINQLVDTFFGTNARARSLDEKTNALVEAFKENSCLMVWDNFESACGIPNSSERGLLQEKDKGFLKQFLKKLRHGQGKVIITSRSPEDWLAIQECHRLPLPGLRGEELWTYCNAVINDFGLAIDRKTKSYGDLIQKLGGNPLAIRAILLRLKDHTADELLAELNEQFVGLQGDESTQRIIAALGAVTLNLPEDFAPVLQLIGLHELYADKDYLKSMLDAAEPPVSTENVDTCLQFLTSAGFCHHLGQNMYSLHPALRTHLLRTYPAAESLQHSFVEFMGGYANSLAPKEYYEQRMEFSIHGTNFHHALALAQQLKTPINVAALTQSLALFAQNSRDYAEAERLFLALAEFSQQVNAPEWEGNAYHQLGMVALGRRDFDSAETWSKKSLEIKEKQGNEYGAAATYHHLGSVALERRDFDAAETGYKKALEIFEKLGNEHSAATTYHQLGRVAQERRDFDAAETGYKKALEIFEKLGDEHGAAFTYHQLGRVAEEQRDFDTAETWYKKALAIREKQGDEHGAASTYHQLGRVALERRDFDAAETGYKKALEIREKQGDEHGAAGTYHQLGSVALERRDFDAAETWYKKSLEIFEKQGNEHGAACTWGRLGILNKKQGDLLASAKCFITSFELFSSSEDPYAARKTVIHFAQLMQKAADDVKDELYTLWQASGLDKRVDREALEKMMSKKEEE